MPRQRSTGIVGSPAAAAETVVAAIAPGAIPAGQQGDPVDLEVTLDLTIGTSGTAVTVKIETGTVAGGTILATHGPFTAVAANRMNFAMQATNPAENYTGYVVTVTVTAGAAVSTVNNVNLSAVW